MSKLRSAAAALPHALKKFLETQKKNRCPTAIVYDPSWFMNSESLLPQRLAGTRHDGWTPERQLAFLAALSLTRSVTRSAAVVGMSRESAYRLRARPHGALFAARWDQILRLRFVPSFQAHEGHDIQVAHASARNMRPASSS